MKSRDRYNDDDNDDDDGNSAYQNTHFFLLKKNIFFFFLLNETNVRLEEYSCRFFKRNKNFEKKEKKEEEKRKNIFICVIVCLFVRLFSTCWVFPLWVLPCRKRHLLPFRLFPHYYRLCFDFELNSVLPFDSLIFFFLVRMLFLRPAWSRTEIPYKINR